MPKIDVNEQLFFNLLGKKYDYSPEFEHLLSSAKAELDEAPSAATPQDERIIKIELNDTNRPDLWSTAGLARLLRMHTGGASNKARYQAFLSTLSERKDSGKRTVTVDPELQHIRPFMTAFVI